MTQFSSLTIAFTFCAWLIWRTRAEETFDQRLQLNQTYVVSWKLEQPDSISFQVEAQTHGWVGLGFGPRGAMTGADLVIGGVWNNGTAYLYDRHGVANAFPPNDDMQNYDLLSGSENDTHTILKFRRKLDTGDKDDWKFDSQLIRILWAFHPEDAASPTDIPIHTDFGHSPKPGISILSNAPSSTSASSLALPNGSQLDATAASSSPGSSDNQRPILVTPTNAISKKDNDQKEKEDNNSNRGNQAVATPLLERGSGGERSEKYVSLLLIVVSITVSVFRK